MHPNHNYWIRYPTLFEAAAGEMLPKQRKSLGYYAAVLSIITKEYTDRIPPEYADCIRIREKDGKLSVRVNRIQVQEIGDWKGFYILASTLPLKAGEMNDIFRLKSCAEEKFSMVAKEPAYASPYKELLLSSDSSNNVNSNSTNSSIGKKEAMLVLALFLLSLEMS
jgi:hypothetical protein